MKKVIVLAITAIFSVALYAHPSEVNEKVLKIFKETFVNAEDVKWSELDNSYAVSFSQLGVFSKVVYDKDGTIVSSTRYYNPERLPLNVYNNLNKKYNDKKLFGVTEIVAGEDVVYYVKMYDAKHWYTIKTDNGGNSEVYEKYKRADAGKLK